MKLPIAKFYGVVGGTVHVNCPCCKEIVKLDTKGNDWRCPDCLNGFEYELTDEIISSAKIQGNTVRSKLLKSTAFLLAFMAKQSGNITDEVQAYVSGFYEMINIAESEWDEVEFFWKAALSEQFDFEPYAIKTFETIGSNSDAASVLGHFMFCVCGASGEIRIEEYELIKDICLRFWSITEEDFEQIYQSAVDQLLSYEVA